MTDFKGRREDERLLTGRGRFVADRCFEGELHAAFLRSDRAHARILCIDKRAALAVPGVKAVFTAADAPHFRTPPAAVKYPIQVPARDVLARERVRHVGQEVALVVATSAAVAHDAAEKIVVEYEDLPAVIDADEAVVPGAPQLYDEVPGNLAAAFEYGDEKATAEACARAAHVVRIALDSNRVAGAPMEPKSCIAVHEAAPERYDLYAPSQGTPLMLPTLAAMTGVPAERIRLFADDVGGGFGVRSEAYNEYAALMHAAKALGRPVKWIGSRFESLVSDHHGRAARLEGELALDAQGRFIGLRIRWRVNSGSTLSQPGPIINTLNPATHAINAYRIPALWGRHELVLTNTTSTTAYRGAGRPNVTYLMERLVDEAASALHVDRAELRRRNLIPKDAFPYKTPVGSVYDSGDPPGELERALKYSNWSSFPERIEFSKKRGKLRGIGLGMFVEPSGGGHAPEEQAAIRFGDSGNPTLYVLSGPSGQGHETMFGRIVAQVLGVAEQSIAVKPSSPEAPPLVGGGTVGSRSMMSHGSALFATAQEVVKKGLDLAAKSLEASAADIEFAEARYRVKGTDLAISFSEIARRYTSALDTQGGIAPKVAFAGGAHVVEVEIDPDTGAIDIVRYVAVDDCGRVLDHTLVDGQLHGGIAQALGQALCEQIAYDSSGQLLTGSFMDYAMPRADMLATVELHDHPVPSPGNLLGVKGVGEAGATGGLPAIANAVIDALRPLGIQHVDFPFSPARIWTAIRAASSGQ